jgi:hypothetical protein
VLGYGAALENPSLYAFVAAALIAVLVVSAWAVKEVRRLTLWLVFWPLCFGMLLSIAIRPIWLDRVFAFCAPFAAIVLGTALARLFAKFQRGHTRIAVSIALTLCAAACIWIAWLQAIAPRKTQYRELARALVAKAAPGEFVYVPENIIYWGVARYLVGPQWGSILEVQDPEQPDFSDAWRKIYARLGPQKLAWLGLAPRTRQIASPAGPLVIGWSPVPEMQTAKSFWMVGNYGVDLATLPMCANRQIVTQRYTGLQLHHVTCMQPG